MHYRKDPVHGAVRNDERVANLPAQVCDGCPEGMGKFEMRKLPDEFLFDEFKILCLYHQISISSLVL